MEGTSVEVLHVHSQFIHVRVWDRRCNSTFLCTAIYAIPHHDKRRDLWEHMEVLVASITKLWMLARDFNVVLHDEECMGSSGSSRPGCKFLYKFYLSVLAHELGFPRSKIYLEEGELISKT